MAKLKNFRQKISHPIILEKAKKHKQSQKNPFFFRVPEIHSFGWFDPDLGHILGERKHEKNAVNPLRFLVEDEKRTSWKMAKFAPRRTVKLNLEHCSNKQKNSARNCSL